MAKKVAKKRKYVRKVLPKFKQELENLNNVIAMQEDKIKRLIQDSQTDYMHFLKEKQDKETLFKNLADMETRLNKQTEYSRKLQTMVDSAKEQGRIMDGLRTIGGHEIKMPTPGQVKRLAEAGYCLGSVEFITNDPVNKPAHYTDSKIEVITFINDKKLNFELGNAVKYICRAGKKDPSKYIEDLEKAIWYIKHEIGTKTKG